MRIRYTDRHTHVRTSLSWMFQYFDRLTFVHILILFLLQVRSPFDFVTDSPHVRRNASCSFAWPLPANSCPRKFF